MPGGKMSSKFKLEDSEFTTAGKKISEELKKSGQIMDRYLMLLEEVCTRGFIQGETNRALLEFHNEIKSTFNHKFSDVSVRVKTRCSKFLQEVDGLDGNLYV